MSIALDRETIAQLIIILALCVGGWMMLIEPRVDELHELQVKIREATANPLLASPDSLDDMVRQLEGVRGRLQRIRNQNQFASDSSYMYSRIMDLAEANAVTVLRLNPGSKQRDKAEAQGEGASVRVTSFDMTVTGQYESIALFLESVDDLAGFVRPVSLTLTPRQGEEGEWVEARFACEAVSFTLPEALAAMVGERDGDG